MTTVTLTNPTAPETPPAAPAAQAAGFPRRYVYCLIDCDSPQSFGPMGIEGGSEVFAVADAGIAAVVSGATAEKFEISRTNAVAHQKVMEAVMQRGHTVLPVKFNTIAEDKGAKPAQQRIVDHVLTGRRRELVGLISTMRPLVELGVKCLWTDIKAVFGAIADSSVEIQSLRRKLQAASKRPANMTAHMRLGELVKNALEARKREMESALMAQLRPLAADYRKNKTFGDPMFANLALLVEKSRQADVEDVLTAFQAKQAGLAKVRCVGPLPPCNFLELVISWDE